MKKQESILEAHGQHTEWLNKLDFYNDDLEILKNRLAEIASKNNNKEILAEIEKFQNQFIVQKENIDTIKHSINLDEDKIQKEINSNPTAFDQRKTSGHSDEKEKVDTFEKNFNVLRADFNKFSSKWM